MSGDLQIATAMDITVTRASDRWNGVSYASGIRPRLDYQRASQGHSLFLPMHSIGTMHRPWTLQPRVAAMAMDIAATRASDRTGASGMQAATLNRDPLCARVEFARLNLLCAHGQCHALFPLPSPPIPRKYGMAMVASPSQNVSAGKSEPHIRRRVSSLAGPGPRARPAVTV
jgi:hypothetical protein